MREIAIKIKEIIDRKSIIENKDNTKEFLMGKMLESIENESYYLLHGGNNHNAQMVSEIKETEFSQNRIQRREIKINFPEDNNAGSPPPLPKSPIPQLPVAAEVAAPRVEDEAAMQLVSARPAIVVEFPKKVSDFGIKKTRAQQSAEARIAKEIEEIQFREAELIRTRINIEPELDTQPPAPIDFPEPSFSSNFPSPVVPDILTHQFTNPPSPLPSPLPPAPPHILPSFPVLEKPKVKPLVDSDSDPEPKYTFYKETAVERDVRLATQREEELRREKQQILQQQQQKIPEPELINVKVLELESQVETLPPFVPLETNSVPVLQAKREPLAKLVLSGPAPSAINYTRVPELKIVPSSPLPVKVNETNEMEIILRSPLPLTPTTPNTPTSASIISGKPWTLNSSNSNGNSNWNGGSLKRGSITNERVAVAGPNRQATKGLMAKFLANHGKPMPVFVPKTTIPHVLPLYDFNSNNNGESNAPNHTNGASTNGHSNGPTNGQVEKSKENIVKSEIVKVQNPKHTVKRLSSVENMILEELRNIQGRELELRKERSTIMTKIEENGETAEVSDSVNYSGAWGLFTLIGNDDNNNNSSVC